MDLSLLKLFIRYLVIFGDTWIMKSMRRYYARQATSLMILICGSVSKNFDPCQLKNDSKWIRKFLFQPWPRRKKVLGEASTCYSTIFPIGWLLHSAAWWYATEMLCWAVWVRKQQKVIMKKGQYTSQYRDWTNLSSLDPSTIDCVY